MPLSPLAPICWFRVLPLLSPAPSIYPSPSLPSLLLHQFFSFRVLPLLSPAPSIYLPPFPSLLPSPPSLPPSLPSLPPPSLLPSPPSLLPPSLSKILTKDSVTVRVDAVVYFRVFDPTASIVNVENVLNATRLYAQTTLRNILGTRTLSDILAEREAISEEMGVSGSADCTMIIIFYCDNS